MFLLVDKLTSTIITKIAFFKCTVVLLKNKKYISVYIILLVLLSFLFAHSYTLYFTDITI